MYLPYVFISSYFINDACLLQRIYDKCNIKVSMKISPEVIYTGGKLAMRKKKLKYSEIHQLNSIFLAFRISIIGIFLK